MFILSALVTVLVLGLVGYLYGLILESFFDFQSAKEVLRFGFIWFIGLLVYWFIGLSVFLMFVSFAPTHKTKSGKADKRYKDNPSNEPELGLFLTVILLCAGGLWYLLGKFNFEIF
ncbi:hypothetical protein KZ322_09785 [Glaesserella parasuis]|uniref:hypothetical protein n=1 Tax=Glaesserella parasuis TaxID=738 RepID=UPI0021BDCF42|nr:hypothetical protein [Glaesserella parasuis]MCT8572524.1 hypothetical protein [Glaesserella parasuis]MCT8686597.1 hypothetical protein [Glaesserella parasuis]MCT8721169.1 hypothetical protein [Glaesserella parasuis]MCT8727094.1 hypothetical protein [Glaesserella parasuis]MCT8752302.1 hypothetical protein [Glaesserella parasuis]